MWKDLCWLSSPRQHPPSPPPFKSIATLLAATTEELLLGAPFFAFKVHKLKNVAQKLAGWVGAVHQGFLGYNQESKGSSSGVFIQWADSSELTHTYLDGRNSHEDNNTQVYSWSIVYILVLSQSMWEWKDFPANIFAFQEDFAFCETQQLQVPNLWPRSQTFISTSKPLHLFIHFFSQQCRLQHSKFKAADNRLAFLSYPFWAPKMWPVTSWGAKLR